MEHYIQLKDQDRIYDPWIRTDVNGRPEIIKGCHRSMIMKGTTSFWESVFNKKITMSGEHILQVVLTPVTIDLENNIAQYQEPNIWIKHQ